MHSITSDASELLCCHQSFPQMNMQLLYIWFNKLTADKLFELVNNVLQKVCKSYKVIENVFNSNCIQMYVSKVL